MKAGSSERWPTALLYSLVLGLITFITVLIVGCGVGSLAVWEPVPLYVVGGGAGRCHRRRLPSFRRCLPLEHGPPRSEHTGLTTITLAFTGDQSLAQTRVRGAAPGVGTGGSGAGLDLSGGCSTGCGRS
jgi:hypothetical protein